MIYKMFDIKGTKKQQDLFVQAMEGCSFPMDLTIAGLRDKFGQTTCPVLWDINMPTSKRGQLIFKTTSTGDFLKGSLRMRFNAKMYDYHGFDPFYLPPYPKKLGVVPDNWVADDDTEDADLLDPPGTTWQEKANQGQTLLHTIVHEVGHYVDATYVTGPMRRRIYNGFHGHLTTDVPPHGHGVFLRDQAHREKPWEITARLDDDKVVEPFFDENGNVDTRDRYQEGNLENPRFTYVPGVAIPNVPGREKGFMRAEIYDFSSISSWLQPVPDKTAVPYPISEKATYKYRVAESFAEAFSEVYSDWQGTNENQYVHNPDTPGIQFLIARTLTPWMLELYPQDQAAGGTGAQEGETVDGLPPYITPDSPGPGVGFIPPGHTYYWPLPLEPMPPTDPVGWTPTPGTGTINGFYATKKEKRFHNAHKNYAPEGAIIYPTREAAVESGKVPCPQCQP